MYADLPLPWGAGGREVVSDMPLVTKTATLELHSSGNRGKTQFFPSFVKLDGLEDYKVTTF